jgi:arylsulfatase
VYYAPGATHAPHHVPKEWIAKFKDQFNQGWDKYREETYQRQLKLGIVPPGTKLTARPKEIPAWDSLSSDEKRVAARLMEVFAAYTAQTDYEIGRVLDALEEIGQLNNTLIFCEIGDNGSSMEGTLSGAFNELATLQGVPESTTFLLQHIDQLEQRQGVQSHPVGWHGL